jgi:hypothetical protein
MIERSSIGTNGTGVLGIPQCSKKRVFRVFITVLDPVERLFTILNYVIVQFSYRYGRLLTFTTRTGNS